jgi:hypothetical protein
MDDQVTRGQILPLTATTRRGGADAGDSRASEEHITNEQDEYVPNGVCTTFTDLNVLFLNEPDLLYNLR